MKLKKNLLPAAFFTLMLFLSTETFSFELQSPEFGFSVDIPEGFFLAEKRGNDRYRFRNTVFPAELQIAVYPAGDFSSGAEALSHITEQIGSGEPAAEFMWRYRKCAVTRLVFEEKQVDGAVIPGGAGWAAAAELPLEKGWLAIASYHYNGAGGNGTWGISEQELESFHLSVLDSFSADAYAKLSPGLVTTFCFPPEGEIKCGFESGNIKLSVPFDKSDMEAGQYVIEREIGILSKYIGSEYPVEAWKRYYRMIFRDSYGRLEKAGFILGNHLPENPEKRAEEFIKWIFSFKYERNLQGSDFLNLPEAFAERRGDCDTRCMLLIVLMKQSGTDGVLLISPEFSHSVAALDIQREGPSFEIDGKKYAVVDLTSSKTNGKLSEEMEDSSKWFAVSF